MEELIPFLLFVIFGIISVIGKVKKIKKKKQGTKARGREGLAVRIHAWLTDLQKRIETQSKKAPKGKLDWEQLIGRSQLESTHTIPTDDALEDVYLEATEQTPSPVPKAKPLRVSPPPHVLKKSSDKSKMMGVETPRMPKKDRRRPTPTVLPTDRSSLRLAVVWSEILGPPISLRDPFRDTR